MPETKQTFSHHHFLWPFRWDLLPKEFGKKDKKERISFDARTCLDGFECCLLEDSSWKPNKFSISDHASYNEFTYFHSFVRKSIYDTEEATDYGYETMRYYEYSLPEGSLYKLTYNVKIGEDEKREPRYEERWLLLSLTGITLHIFNTGVGILSYDLANQEESQSDKATILLINEFGRRTYPQFLDANNSVKGTKKAFLASEVTIAFNESEILTENYSDYNLDKGNISAAKTFLPPKFIAGLFNSNFEFHLEGELEKEKVLLSRVMDDRMFFLCWYGDTALTQKDEPKEYKNWDWWYCFVFGDKEWKSVANKVIQEEQLLKHTYGRWSEYGTLYGMSHDSFVCLSPDIETMIKGDIPRFDVHMNTMYYQIAVLCLAQRASVLKFSAEISNLSELEDPRDKELSRGTKSIYWNYIQFKNKIYFREISAQIQGIEIYNRFQEIMNIPAEVEILEDKIEAIHNYLSMQEGETMNREMHWLTQIATFFLPASFIASMFGIGLINEKTRVTGQMDSNVWEVWAVIIGLGLLLSIPLLFRKRISKLFKRNKDV